MQSTLQSRYHHRRFWRIPTWVLVSLRRMLWIGAQDAEFIGVQTDQRWSSCCLPKRDSTVYPYNMNSGSQHRIQNLYCNGKIPWQLQMSCWFFFREYGVVPYGKCQMGYGSYIHVSIPSENTVDRKKNVFRLMMGKACTSLHTNQIKRPDSKGALCPRRKRHTLHSHVVWNTAIHLYFFQTSSIITTSSSEILVKSISQLQQLLENDFISVQELSCKSGLQLASIERYTVTMVIANASDSTEEKYNEIRDLLLHFYNGDGSTDNNI